MAASLREQAEQFHVELDEIKAKNPLDPGSGWYPYTSLSQFAILDRMLGGDPSRLTSLIGTQPALDLGCGDGDNAFFLEHLLLENDPERPPEIHAVDLPPTNFNGLRGVRKMAELRASRVQVHTVDMDTWPQLPREDYGFALMLGLLYHLKNPFLALEAVARSARHVFLSTRIATHAPDLVTRYENHALAYLVDEDELNSDATNFWIFTRAGLERILQRAGWQVLHYAATGPEASDPVSSAGDARAFVLAKSHRAFPQQGLHLLDGWHEVEFHAWRWTAREFSVELDVQEAIENASLRFIFQLPAALLSQFGSVTLSASCNAKPLQPAIFTKAGDHEFAAEAGELAAGKTVIRFSLNTAIGPSENDRRQLGLQVDFTKDPPIQVR